MISCWADLTSNQTAFDCCQDRKDSIVPLVIICMLAIVVVDKIHSREKY